MFRLAALLITVFFAPGSPAWGQWVSGGAGPGRFAAGSARTGVFSQNFQQNPSGFLKAPHFGGAQPSHGFHSHGHGGQIIIDNSSTFHHPSRGRVLDSTVPSKPALLPARKEHRGIHIHRPPLHWGLPKHKGILIIEVPRNVIETRVTTHPAPVVPSEDFSGAGTDRQVTQWGLPRKSARHIAPFDPTPQEIVGRMLELAGVKNDDVVYDLGSGDGRIVIAAAKKYGARAVGFEIDPGLVKLARENVRKEGLENLVEIRQEDITRADLSPATVVTLYLSFDGNLKVRPLLKRQLKPGTRVVSYHFDMGDWQPKIVEAYRDSVGEVHTLYLWLIPGPFAYSGSR